VVGIIPKCPYVSLSDRDPEHQKNREDEEEIVKNSRVAIFSILATLLAVWTAQAATPLSPREKVELTVYNQDFALVKEQRRLELKKGLNVASLEEVAAQIDPSSVHFKSLTAPEKVRILEQNYEFDLVNPGKLLQKYVGKEVEIHQTVDFKTDEIRIKKARLLSSGYAPQPQQVRYGLRPTYQYVNYGQPLFEIDGKIYSNAPGTVVLPALPEELILKPTLSLQLESQAGGLHTTELSYMTSGIKWIADYVTLLNPDDTKLDLTGWVTLDNRSGAAYEEAKLKLIAGDVHLAGPEGVSTGPETRRDFGISDEKVKPQFIEKAFFEYHLYTLQRPATIKDNEVKQIEFATAAQIPVSKRYLYDGFQLDQRYSNWDVASYRTRPEIGAEGQTKVWVTLEFKNSKENNLGIPLPKGRIRLYKEDADKGQEFVGEDTIDHTPKDEMIKLYAGNAFDLVGSRKQVDFKIVDPSHIVEESFEITLRNHKQEEVTVTVREHLYRWREWDILKSSHPFEKKDVQTIEFPIRVPKDGEVKITYLVRYRW